MGLLGGQRPRLGRQGDWFKEALKNLPKTQDVPIGEVWATLGQA